MNTYKDFQELPYPCEYDLMQVTIPERTNSYEPVPHMTLINAIKEKLEKHNLPLTSTKYAVNGRGQQMFGLFNLGVGGEEDCLNIGFRNSYDKTLPVGLVAGGTVIVCSNLMFRGEIKMLRKHTKNVYSDLDTLVENVISTAVFQYEQLVEDKERMKLKLLSKTEMAELAGRMYVEEKLLTPNQMSVVAEEIRTSSQFIEPRLWDFYNHITEGLKKSHPSKIMQNHIQAHGFVMQFA
jgi:hypothetical protein